MSPSNRIRRIAIITGASVLASTGATALASAQSSDTTSQATSTTKQARPHGRAPKLTDAQLQTVASKLGVTVDALKAAMSATRPAQPAKNGFAADLASALGVETSAVQTILDANRPTTPPARGTKPDDAKLVAALADGLKLDSATVQAALDKLHATHGPGARDAALAKALGKTTAEVKAAFDSVRPARPAA